MASKKSLAGENIESTSFKNDNTYKILGTKYQELIALEKCMSAKPNENVWIECKGDVADRDTSIEVKHHNSNHNLTNNSEDVWKTIKNYVDNFHVTKTFSHLILHTTSSIPENSIFYDWNNLSKNQKQTKLIGHNASDSIKEYYDKIKNCPPKDLLVILDRFSIISNQPRIADMWEELKTHPALIIVPEKFHDEAIELLYGYITKIAINNGKMWQVNINDFRSDMQHTLSKFTTDQIPFHSILKSDVELNISNHKFEFLRKMNDVGLKDKDQISAVYDYLRAQKSQLKMLSMSPTLIANLEQYDEDVKKVLNEEKSCKSYNLIIEEIGSNKANQESRDLYFICINKPHDQINGVNGTQKYYRDGRIHHITEESNFEWRYGEIDLQ